MRFDVGLQRGGGGGAIAHVEGEQAGGAAQRGDLGHHGLRLVHPGAAVHHHVEAVAGGAQGDGAADAAARASHENGVSHG